MKAISSAILVATMACLVPAQAMADEVKISLDDLFKRARAATVPQRTLPPTATLNRSNRGAAQRFIGKKGPGFGNINITGEYVTISGCVSPNTNPTMEQCEYEVQLIADGFKDHAPVALLLLKTHLKLRPEIDEDGNHPDDGYRVVDAIVTQDYPGYTLKMYGCTVNGQRDQGVFAYASDQQDAGSIVKAWRATYESDQIVEIPTAGVTCKSDH